MKLVLQSMGSLRSNSYLRDFRGKVGDFIYKWYGKRLVVTRAPRKSTKPRSAKQKGGNNRFAAASRYAEKARSDPAVWAVYAAAAKKRRIPVRALAIQDYLTKPKISDLSLQNMINAKAAIDVFVGDTQTFKTSAVTVTLQGANGKLLESGAARYVGRQHWTYALRTSVPGSTPLTIRVEASDRCGRSTTGSWTGLPGDKSPREVTE